MLVPRSRVQHLLVALTLVLSAAETARAQAPTAIVAGRVQAMRGDPIADATVRFVSASPAVETRTDVSGHFAIVGLAAGTYEVRATAAGHRSARLARAVLTPGQNARLVISLPVGDPYEWTAIERHRLVRVDSTSSETLAEPLLAHLPLERRDALTAVPNALPGISRGSAFGGPAGTSTVRRVDGIDLSDPMDGSAWTSHIATTAYQITIRPAGAGAGEGGFSNTLVDVVTEAGGIRLSGMVDALFTTDGLTGTNLSDEQLAESPQLAGPDALRRSIDASGLVGGALYRDRGQFMAAFGFAQERHDPIGPRTRLEDTTPRVQGRLSVTRGAAETVSASLLFDRPSIDGVAASGVTGIVDDPVADRLSGRTFGTRVLWQRQLTPRLPFELSYCLLAGARQLEPATLVPGRLDAITAEYAGSQGLLHDSRRQRHRVAARVARDVSAAGSHLFVAGAEIEIGRISEDSTFVEDQFFVDLAGRPNLVLEWAGEHRQGRSRRESVFIEDSWTAAPRLTVNAGVRADFLHGAAPDVGEVYRATTLQPRAGATVDLFGNGRTVARAHYGIYADPLYFSHYDRATPGASPLVTFEFLSSGARREVERLVTPDYRVESDLRHPSSIETSFGVDHALAHGASVGVTAVFREARDVVDAYFTDARWVAISRPGLNNVPITVYRWSNRLASQASGVIDNVDGVSYTSSNGATLGTVDARRKSRAVILHGRLDDPRERWTILGGVTLSRVTGTLDNTFAAGVGRSSQFESPSAALLNVDGRASQTPEREYTALATVRVPGIEARVSAVYVGQDGLYYAAVRQFGAETLDFPVSEAGRRVLLEERGSRALEMDHRLDLRVEYGIGGSPRVTVYADITNVLNRATVLRVEERYPFATAGGTGINLFDEPVEVRTPRQIFVGARLRF